ncbi:oxygenase MpaB family protein [Noviherbaspirillum sp. Root189]|uniref:oxygenase MpaB family protein n=1 Tax=Noviherbaspirillum sp. Root189 TaxID=1736487 RepID=UPI00071016FA|nr:oxygenase MpaB family protein [Noviherbaspirillum sp. Root189]KRB64252.1 histidine kinase [Noviherbaspirillum sp. Root189]
MIWLPSSLRDWLDGQTSQLLYPVPSSAAYFLTPVGEPALASADSVSWRIFKNPVALFIGGISAVLLELAHPSVRSGVWEHTSFRTHPRQRIQRTGFAAMVTVYAPRSRAEEMIAAVGARHRRIRGVTPSGVAYRADDPELLTWVHATAAYGFLEAYHAFVHPLAEPQRDAFYAEGKTSAGLYGANNAPSSDAECKALCETTLPTLEPSDIVHEFLGIMAKTPLLPPPLSGLQPFLLNAAVHLVPEPVRGVLGLDMHWRFPSWQRGLVMQAGRAADRIPMAHSPAVLSCRRLGLADNFLYRKWTASK